MSSKVAKLFGLLSSAKNAQVLKDAEKQAKLARRNILSDNLATMLANGTLWGELRQASFLTQSGGQIVRKFNADSLFSRFSTPQDEGKNHEDFAKELLPAIKNTACVYFSFLAPGIKDEEGNGISFDLKDKSDCMVAWQVLGEHYEFGSTVHVRPKVMIRSNLYNAAEAAAKAFFESQD